MKTTQIVEAVLFASDAPLDASEIARADAALDEDAVERAIQELKTEYEEADRAFEIQYIAEGYQILTRPEFSPYLERFDTVPRPNRLSGPAIEALAIIAYRQPIGRIEMEYIRGVSSAGVIRTLTERNLVDVVGRDEGLGRPFLYGTTKRFLEHFGFASLEDLPRPEELPVILRERVPILPVDETEAEAGADGESSDDGEGGNDPGSDSTPGSDVAGDADVEHESPAEAAEASSNSAEEVAVEPGGTVTIDGPLSVIADASAENGSEASHGLPIAEVDTTTIPEPILPLDEADAPVWESDPA